MNRDQTCWVSTAHRRGRMAARMITLALAGLASACAAPQRAPAAAAGPSAEALPAARVRTASYELYAPNDAVAEAVRQELDRGAAIFERHFGVAPPLIGVMVFNSTDEMRAFDWAPFRARFRAVLPWLVQFEGDPTVSATGVEGQRAISHEACHVFLMAQTSVTLGRTAGPAARPGAGAPRSYGDPALPDWFDEGVATLCEPEALHESRVAQLRAVADSTIPLAELFSMEHPVWRQLQNVMDAQRAGAGDTARVPGTGPGITRLRVRPGEFGGTRGITFYSQTNSVLEFMAEREGPVFVARLGEGLARGKTVEEVLAAHARRLPHGIPALEQEWKAWHTTR